MPIQVELVLRKNKTYIGKRYVEVTLAKKLVRPCLMAARLASCMLFCKSCEHLAHVAHALYRVYIACFVAKICHCLLRSSVDFAYKAQFMLAVKLLLISCIELINQQGNQRQHTQHPGICRNSTKPSMQWYATTLRTAPHRPNPMTGATKSMSPDMHDRPALCAEGIAAGTAANMGVAAGTGVLKVHNLAGHVQIGRKEKEQERLHLWHIFNIKPGDIPDCPNTGRKRKHVRAHA